MKSPKGHDLSDDRTVIDIKDTAEKHQELSKYILQLHALTGADCIPALFKVGKKRALNTLTCFKGGFRTLKTWLQLAIFLLILKMLFFQGQNFSLVVMERHMPKLAIQ